MCNGVPVSDACDDVMWPELVRRTNTLLLTGIEYQPGLAERLGWRPLKKTRCHNLLA